MEMGGDLFYAQIFGEPASIGPSASMEHTFAHRSENTPIYYNRGTII
jgi:hypothetical protein